MSFSFSFNLELDDVDQDNRTADCHPVPLDSEDCSMNNNLIPCFEVKCPQQLVDHAISAEFSVHIVGELVFKEALNASPDNNFDEESDLIPGKYEGGFKIWECSHDLGCIIADYTGILPPNPKKILELGCGHGLPAIISMLTFDDLTEVVFSDFNSEVLEATTWPNILLNCPQQCDNVRCIAGDWASLSSLIGNYDLILSAETLYTVESCRKVIAILIPWRF